MITQSMATPDKKEETQDPDTPSSAESEKSAQAVSPPVGDGFSNTQLAQLQGLLQGLLNPIVGELGSINKRLSTLEARTGLLVEEKARKMAARQFGEDFSRRFCIKSVHDLVKLISKANTSQLRSDDFESRFDAVKKLTGLLKPLLPDFMKAMVDSVKKALDCPEFANDAFVEIKESFFAMAVKPFDESQPDSDSLDMKRICGITICTVKKLSETTLVGENTESPALQARAKLMNARFKRKLDRMKKAFEGKHDLATCESAGIMLLSFLSHAGKEVWKGGETGLRTWVRSGSEDIFDFKEEIECDLMPLVSVVSQHATLMVGEIKSTIDDYGKACKQMLYEAKLLELGLFFLVQDNFASIVKKGHLFVLEARKNDQRLEPKLQENDLSVFVHQAI